MTHEEEHPKIGDCWKVVYEILDGPIPGPTALLHDLYKVNMKHQIQSPFYEDDDQPCYLAIVWDKRHFLGYEETGDSFSEALAKATCMALRDGG